jgi:soluble lytic murein transglycosylase-like protein
MSAAAVMARVDEIQTRIDMLRGTAPAPQAAPNQSFQAALTQAAAAGGQTPAGAVGGLTPVGGAGGQTPFAAEIEAAAQRHGIDPALLKGLIRQESNFNPTAGSPAGARGLAQLMPATAASLGVTDVTDPAQSIEGGAKYLKQQLDRFGGDVTKALAAYNAGPGAVAKFGGVPPYAETQQYVQKVQAYAEQYRGASAPAPVPAAVPPQTQPIATSPAAYGIT